MSGVTEKPSPTVLTEAGKLQIDLLEKEWPNVQPPVEYPKPECGAVGFYIKASIALRADDQMLEMPQKSHM